MKRKYPILWKLQTCLFASLVFLSSLSAHSAGFQISEQSGTGLGRAFAGFGVIGDDLSMAFYNPAGITIKEGTQFQISGYVVNGRAKFTNRGSTQSFPPVFINIPTTGGNKNGGTTTFVPNLYFVTDLTEKLKFGFAITSPYGLKTNYDRQWVGRFHADKSELVTTNLNPSFAYKVNGATSIGVGFSAQYADSTLSQAISNGPAILGIPEGFAELEGDDWGYGWNIGFLYHPDPSFRAAVGYRSKINHKLRGDNEITGVPSLGGTFKSRATARVTLPETIHTGVYKEFSTKWGVSAGFRWTRWNRFDELRLKTNGLPDSVTDESWGNAYSVNVGIDYFYSDKWTFRAGYMFDQTPVPDKTRNPRVPDEDRHWIAIGATFKANQKFQIDFGYSHIFFDNADVNVTVPIAGGTGIDNLVGTYNDQRANVATIQAVYQF